MSIFSDIGSYYKNLGNRALEATGLKKPADLVDEDAILKETEGRAADLYSRGLAAAGQAGAWQGPADIRDVAPIGAREVQAEGVSAPTTAVDTMGRATDAGPVERYQVALATAPGAVDSDIRADNLGSAAQIDATRVGRTSIDPAADAARGESLAAARKLGDTSGIQGAAQAQFAAALAKAQREGLATAASARGADRAGARRDAMLSANEAALGGAQAITAEALKAANEREQMAAGALQGVRGTDVQLATDRARLDQDANALEAQIDAAMKQGNAAAANQLRQKQADLRLQAKGMSADVQAGNAQRVMQTALANQGATNTAAQFGAGSANDAAQKAADRGTAVSESGLTRGLQQATTNADRTFAASKATADARNTAAAGNADRGLAADTATGTLRLQRDQAQGAQTINTQQTRQAGTAAGLSAAGQAAGIGAQAAGSKIAGATGQQTREDASSGRLIDTAKAAAAASDERVKTDVKDIPPGQLADMAEAMKKISFKYKPGVEDGGAKEHMGTTAQSLEKTPAGRKFTFENEDGIKHVDYGALAATLASVAVPALRKAKESRANG